MDDVVLYLTDPMNFLMCINEKSQNFGSASSLYANNNKMETDRINMDPPLMAQIKRLHTKNGAQSHGDTLESNFL